VQTKVCCTCRHPLPVEEFYPRPDSRDGLQSRCKPCALASARASERRNRARTRARSAARRALLLQRTPEWCREGTQGHDDIIDVYELADLLTIVTGFKFVVDHKIPLAKGGMHQPDNLTPLRDDLNASKRDRLNWTPPSPVFEKVTDLTETECPSCLLSTE
jgi:5-methylcytosine-specific restriction endonuclease McrA